MFPREQELVLYIGVCELRDCLKLGGPQDNHVLEEAIAGLAWNGLLGVSSRIEQKCDALLYPTTRGARLFLGALGFRSLNPYLLVTVDVGSHLSSDMAEQIALPSGVTWKYVKAPASTERLLQDLAMLNRMHSEGIEDLAKRIEDIDGRVRFSE